MLISSSRASFFLWTFFPFPIILALFIFFSNKLYLITWDFMLFSSSSFSMSCIIDYYGCLFSSVVLFISANVLIFSSSYIQDELFIKRFVHLVLLFVLSINFLIFIPNLICLLIGWDGLGIVSFVLVIYYQNPKSLAAGIITALINRVGDVIILISIGIILSLGHWSVLHVWSSPLSFFYVLFLIIAAITKSAQIPFSRWLPAAIAAPTPVSALVHSSTLVTAGVFLLFRFHYFFSSLPWFKPTLLIIATLTIFIAGMRALAECDIKKIIALSTLRQLGVMMSRLGLGLPILAFFHLLTHALFKALLFLTAGSIIHFHHHSQDLRFIGSLTNSSPLSLSALTIANLALCGSPFIAGFYSKDLILESSVAFPFRLLIVFLFFFATALTARYSIRFIISTIWAQPLSLPSVYMNDLTTKITYPMLFLRGGAILGGASFRWLAFFSLGEPVLPFYLKSLAILVTVIGLIFSIFLTSSFPSLWKIAPLPHFITASIWILTPSISQRLINWPLTLAHSFFKTLDQGWIEILGPKGAFITFSDSSSLTLTPQFSIITAHLSIALLFLYFLVSIY